MQRRECFIIESGCVYEGGGVVAVSLNLEKAIQYSEKIVSKKQKEDDEHRAWEIKSHIEFVKKDPESYDIEDPDNYNGEDYEFVTKDWKEEDAGAYEKYWSNGMDYISIVKQQLI